MKNRNDNQWGAEGRGRSRNNLLTGAFFLVVGALLLARATGILFPDWFFTWPMFLIGIGIFSGARQNFRGGSWLIPILVGVVFLADKLSDQFNLRPFFWPILFLSIGAYIMLGGRRRGLLSNREANDALPASGDGNETSLAQPTYNDSDGYTVSNDPSDALEITSIFSGVKKNVISKNFKGGEVLAIMGGAEINLMKADFNQKVSIDMFAMFGGIKLFVPADWNVQSNVVAIFGGVDDKRPPSNTLNERKVIFLEGNAIFGGIEIRSY